LGFRRAFTNLTAEIAGREIRDKIEPTVAELRIGNPAALVPLNALSIS
jgi:hypothetical protein